MNINDPGTLITGRRFGTPESSRKDHRSLAAAGEGLFNIGFDVALAGAGDGLVDGWGGLAAAVVSGGLTGAWVGWTYG